MFVKYLIIMYLMYAIMVIVHELFHVITAKLFHFNIVKIELGNFFYIHIKKLYISPFIFSGAVDIDLDSTIDKKSSYVVAFFLSGILGNLLLIILLLILFDNIIIFTWGVIINSISILFSVFPFTENNDVSVLCYCLKKKKSVSDCAE